MTIAIIIISVLVVVGFVVFFVIKNNKPKPTPVPDTGSTPDTGETPDTGTTPDTGETEPTCICESETHRIQGKVGYLASPERVKIGWYENDNMCDCKWSIIGFKDGVNFLSDIKFENGDITAIVSDTNYGDERSTRYLTRLEGKDVSKDDFFDVTQDSSVDEDFEKLLSAFNKYVNVEDGSETYKYIQKLYEEAKEQFYNGKSLNGIPKLFKEENFPTIYNYYGENGDEDSAFNTLAGWLVAMVLSELKPTERTNLFEIGYEYGGYNKYSNIYGYKFKYDPNVVRLVASAVYSTMRGVITPNIDAMRNEVGGSKYDKDLETLADGNRSEVGKDDFFTDFRAFMPTAPGPYAPGYDKRPDNTYPNEEKDEYNNLSMDRNIHESIVGSYNLNKATFSARTVQAIADEEGCTNHLLGGNDIVVENYKFSPVFGNTTLGISLSPTGYLAKIVKDSQSAASSSRGILQSVSVNPKQYGRLRPGCSWTSEGQKNSKSDDRRNVLCDIDIEDNDGCKDTPSSVGYYDKNGVWTHTTVEASQFCETQKKNLYANSYPSGHSSGIWGAALTLMELMPDKADLLMRAANLFAVNRTVARYHWTSDTINGRVLGSATNAVSHAASDYDELLNKSKKEL
jgi:hypothetical protein